MSLVFISHSSEDAQIAESIYNDLNRRGINCWMAPNNIAPGEDWANSINNAITSSPVFLIIYSRNSAASTQVPRELTLAANKGAKFITYYVDDTPLDGAFGYYLSNGNAVKADLAHNDLRIDDLANAIYGALNNTQTNPSVTPLPMVAPQPAAPAKGINWGVLSIILISIVVVIAVVLSFLLPPKDDNDDSDSSNGSSQHDDNEDEDEDNSNADDDSDTVAITQSMIDTWKTSAIDSVINNDKDTFRTLFAEGTTDDTIDNFYTKLRDIYVANSRVQSDYTYIASDTDNQCYCYMYFYTNNIGGDPFNTMDYTTDAYFITDKDGKALFTSSPDDNTKSAMKAYFSEKFGDYFTDVKGYLPDRYWTLTEKSLLSGINCKVQKMKQNDDGSMDISIAFANGLDVPIYDIKLYNSTDVTTIALETPTVEYLEIYEASATSITVNTYAPSKIAPGEFAVYEFTIAAADLPDGVDMSVCESFYFHPYLTYWTDEDGTHLEYPVASPTQRSDAQTNAEKWMRSVMDYAQKGDFTSFKTLFADDVDAQYYYDKMRYFYTGGNDGTITAPSVYIDVSGIFRNYASVDLMVFGEYSTYQRKDDSLYAWFNLEFCDNGTIIASKKGHKALTNEYHIYYKELFGIDYSNSFTSGRYWLMYKIPLINSVKLDLRSASMTDDGSLRLEFGCANGTDKTVVDLKLDSGKTPSTVYIENDDGTQTLLFDFHTTPFTVIDDWSAAIYADTYDAYVIQIAAADLPANFDPEKLFSYTETSTNYSWNWG